jgi:putative polyketide hydroxylase
MSEEETEVLVVGGSLVGLSTALFLRTQGIDVVLVERHPGTSIHPRTPGYNARSMELFRAAGVEDALRAADHWPVTESGLLWTESLTSSHFRWLEPPGMRRSWDNISELSPCDGARLSQDKVEPVLREHAESRGADVRFGTELVSFSADPDGVSAVIVERASGHRRTVRAKYLVAADGTGSRVRSALGISREGLGALENKVSIMVRADLSDALRDKRFVICQVENAQISAFVRIVGDLMSLNVGYSPELGEATEQFTDQRCVEIARAVSGVDDLSVEPKGVLAWQPTAAVARKFAQGPVFLAGDAAHVMPPNGAYGANTGIQDAWNLAWKLGFVLRGWADAALLDTYEAERRPVAELTVDQALVRGKLWFHTDYPSEVDEIELIDDRTVMFGYRYRSAAVITESNEPTEDPLDPTGQPGTRMPHIWLEQDGRRISTVDMWATGLVLLAGAEGHPLISAAHEVAQRHGVPIAAHRLGSEVTPTGTSSLLDVEQRFPDLVGSTGAVLVRPDGFIAWRAHAVPEHPTGTLDTVLRRLLGRGADLV